MPQIKAKYIDTGKVYYVYKDFPILTTHPQAEYAAQAAECAGDQNKYWAMHDQLFARPGEWDTTTRVALDAFNRYADAIGLDRVAFQQCLTDGRYRTEVQRDFNEGRRLGITGTPSFIINGKLLSGARPFEQFEQVLDQELIGR